MVPQNERNELVIFNWPSVWARSGPNREKWRSRLSRGPSKIEDLTPGQTRTISDSEFFNWQISCRSVLRNEQGFGAGSRFHDEAIDFIRDHIPPGSAGPEIWTTIVRACKLHKNFKLEVKEADNPGYYAQLSNHLYVLAGMTDRRREARFQTKIYNAFIFIIDGI